MIAMETAALVVLAVMSAFFSSAESALFSLNPLQVHRIRASRAKAAERIERVLGHPTWLLSGLLIGNTVANVGIASLGYNLIERLLPARGVALAIPAVTTFLLIFGEVTPKRVALRWPESLSVLYAAPLEWMIWLMTPVRKVLGSLALWLERMMGPASIGLTEGEFRTALGIGEERGLLDKEERRIVEGVLRLEGLRASDVMTPRVDMVAVDAASDAVAIESVAREARRKYLPVYRETVDRVEGLLDVRRFLLAEQRDVRACVLPVAFVPETMPLDVLLATMRSDRSLIVCVKDEFGGTAGVVTQGDILEEIVAGVGAPETFLKRLVRNRWLAAGSVGLEDINYVLDLQLEAEGVDRLGGWIAVQLERMPRPRDVVEAQGCRVLVRQVADERVVDATIEKLEGS